MARFNRKDVGTKTVNLAGGEAFAESSRLEFVSILLTSFVQDSFYRSADDTAARIVRLVDSMPDKRFCAKTALLARNEYGMRTVSHIVAAELAARVKGERWSKRFYDLVIHRVDDITEILAYYLGKYGKPIPNSLKKGLGAALGRFDAYQIAKYRAEGSELSLVDVVNLIHPRPTEKNADALKALMADTLRSVDTWETKLTQAGQKAEGDKQKQELKAEAWAGLIRERKLGYFALLRNLRNIMQQAPDVLPEALVMLTDEALIRKSLVLPFRFLTATGEIQQLDGARKVLVALSKAVDISLVNVPKLGGKTLVALDSSGSMTGKPAEIGSLFAAILYKTNDAELMLFSSDADYLSLNPMDSTLTLAGKIRSHMAMGGTNFRAIFERASKAYDRIVILSDMQAWMGFDAPTATLSAYKKRMDCDPLIYSWNLEDYGTLAFPERNVYALAGWSDKAFDIMALLETDKQALLHRIEAVEL